MGGDEFMVLLRNIGSEDDVIPRSNMLCYLLRRKYADKGEVSFSMGVVFYPCDGEIFQELYQNADTALYKVKSTGRGNYGIYKPER
ncbi:MULTISPECIES: diguanylate cyclase domain-containing protein [Anaerostipes]|uniref:Diguanylate cyclase n=1 Tax=Anaerostipes hominis (ex Lee et al. 2021) TaxID=2025494 RepID=A0ABV4DGY8_9FIRM|nr:MULTISPECIES: diguanylate cyclase [Anaerostipes]